MGEALPQFTRRAFLATALSSACVPVNALEEVAANSRGLSFYLGRRAERWVLQLSGICLESSHALEAISAFGTKAVLAAVEVWLQEPGPRTDSPVRQLVQLGAERDPGIAGRILDLSKTNEAWQVDCHALLVQFVDRMESVAVALADAAVTADPYSAAFFLEPLVDAGKAIPVALVKNLVHEYEEIIADTKIDESGRESQLLRDLLPDLGLLVRAVLCAEATTSERIALLDRLLRRQRLDDDVASSFVPQFSRLGADGIARLISYAASTLLRTSQSACELLGRSSEFSSAHFHQMASSQDAACRTAAYRTLCKFVAIPSDLLPATETAIDDSDAGVRVWAAATLIRHCGKRPDAEAVLGWAIRRPENALRRWVMEGLADVAESVDAVDHHLARLLRDTEEDVQLTALRRLRSLRIQLPAIVELVGEIWLGRMKADAIVRFEAAEYLAEVGHAALPVAWQGLHGNNSRVQSQAIRLFGRLGPQAIEAASAVADYWHQGDPIDREAILWALGQMKAARQLLPLVWEAWRTQDSELVPIAAGVMHVFSHHDRRTLRPLVIQALRCRHRDVQAAAALSLRLLGAGVVDELILLAASADPFDRLGAVLGLTEFVEISAAARAVVQQASRDPNLAVRLAACRSVA